VLPVFALVSGFLAYTGYFMMYSLSVVSDDEGYWLIALRSYHQHGSLYHNTYSQVGPFYHELWSAVFSVLGMPIDHDLGRALTLGVWVATSLCFGVALWLLTGRLVLGVLAQVTTFLLIDTLINEPMEPAGLAGLLIGILLLGLALVVRRRERLGMAVVGAASAAVLLTKVNIGVFVVGAVCYSILVCWPTRRWQLGRQALGALVLLAVPAVLMSGLIGISWVDRYLCPRRALDRGVHRCRRRGRWSRSAPAVVQPTGRRLVPGRGAERGRREQRHRACQRHESIRARVGGVFLSAKPAPVLLLPARRVEVGACMGPPAVPPPPCCTRSSGGHRS